MIIRRALPGHSLPVVLSCALTLLSISSSWHGLRASAGALSVHTEQQWIGLESSVVEEAGSPYVESSKNETLDVLLDALSVMQDRYFDVSTGTWPSSIDWTAAVLGTHVSASLFTLVSSIDSLSTDVSSACSEALAWSDLINRYFAQISVFFFGENSLSLRQQAYDDMLWVVLGWLEDVKLIDLVNSIDPSTREGKNNIPGRRSWHGTQFKAPAAHRARTFYELASQGWDTLLCDGGMMWSPYARPYKNSITNELFISASVSMYLYFPGDQNNSPFISTATEKPMSSNPHDPRHLENAIKAYDWLRNSNMTSPNSPGLYADGFHIRGWHQEPSGRVDPGTGNCDMLNTMVYTYNQGVVLTGLRGLWLAQGWQRYLDDGHELISSAIQATGWPNTDGADWAGLGRGGVIEDYCDSSGICSQNGHTFKGIFFHHFAEFCRPLSLPEEIFLSSRDLVIDREIWADHLHQCDSYQAWVAHNARAAAVTRDKQGRFGMWWGQVGWFSSDEQGDNTKDHTGYHSLAPPYLPAGAIDHQNRDGLAIAPLSPSSSPFSSPYSPLTFSSSDVSTGHKDVNDRGRGRTVETQSGGLAVFRALWQWERVAAAGATTGQRESSSSSSASN